MIHIKTAACSLPLRLDFTIVIPPFPARFSGAVFQQRRCTYLEIHAHRESAVNIAIRGRFEGTASKGIQTHVGKIVFVEEVINSDKRRDRGTGDHKVATKAQVGHGVLTRPHGISIIREESSDVNNIPCRIEAA